MLTYTLRKMLMKIWYNYYVLLKCKNIVTETRHTKKKEKEKRKRLTG